LAVNRLGEKGEWNLNELKIEFEELILTDAPIEVSGFSLSEIDQIVLGDAGDAMEQGPLAPEAKAVAVAELGDIFQLRAHRVICGSATDPSTLHGLMNGDDPARLIITDEPYNVPISGHVTGGAHREFAMASGEMSDVEFLAFNVSWMEAAVLYLCEGGVFGTFIDWRGYSTVFAAATKLGLDPLNLVVWTKTNAGMGGLYRSQHELLPLFKNGTAPHVNNIELGRHGRWRSNVWTYPGASSLGSENQCRTTPLEQTSLPCLSTAAQPSLARGPRSRQPRRHCIWIRRYSPFKPRSRLQTVETRKRCARRKSSSWRISLQGSRRHESWTLSTSLG
jgi:hypothetical protein